MTTNQTIDGVSRDDLELVLLHGHSTHESDRAWDRLRVLLDAPPRCPVCGYTEQDCREQMDHYLCGSPEPAPANKRAAQPQGEQLACMPVERCYDVRAKMIIAFNEAKKAGGDLDDALDAAYKSALRYSPNPLSAEQPAPVVVAVPERLVMTDGLHTYEYVTGHNAAIDKMLGVKS